MEQAIETTANIYDHVQEYEERRTLVHYMARLAAPAFQDARMEKYMQKVHRNIVLEQYFRAVAAVRQWAFPFTSVFLGDLALLQQFSEAHSIQDFMDLVKRQVKLLKDKVDGHYMEINSAVDSFLWTGQFSGTNKRMLRGPMVLSMCGIPVRIHGR